MTSNEALEKLLDVHNCYIVRKGKNYINQLGGFEKLAKWGLIRYMGSKSSIAESIVNMLPNGR